ncbi:MAG: hypothetical protein KDJ75_10415 [Alphaproteobacteria bacterium]|nr:hypothetical protein [Alphaproteobacteria bacterium]
MMSGYVGDYINTDPFLLFFGSFYLILGFSCFFARKPWEEFIALFVDNDALSLVMGIVILPIALFIIVFYDNWETLSSIVLMALGYIAFFKALILLMRPRIIQAYVRKEFVRKWLWLDGVSGIVLGAAILFL